MKVHDRYRGTGERRVARCLAVLLTALISCPAAAAFGVTLDGSSRTYWTSREAIGGSNLRPGYEYLDLAIRDIGNEQFSVHFGGWGRYDFKQETGSTDLQYAFLSYKRKEDNSVLNLGRIMVFEGVSAERVDGAYARTDILGPALGISAYGGMPTEVGFDLPGDSLIYGARLYHSNPEIYTVGVSFLKEERNDLDFRKEEGIDIWVRPASRAELLGWSSYDSISRGFMEHDYNLILGPFSKVRFNTAASMYRYEAFVREATTPALQFSNSLVPGLVLTTGLLDPNEVTKVLGEEVSYAVNDNVTVFANYRGYDYKIAGNAHSYGGRISYSRSAGAAGFSADRMAGDEQRLKYTQYRLYGSRMIGKLDIAVDLIDLVFDQETAGVDTSYSASLALTYDLTRSLRIGADAEYLTGPTFNREMKYFVKLIYLFGFNLGGGAS